MKQGWGGVVAPSIEDGHNAGPILGDAKEDGLGEIEVVVGRIAAPSRRAEVSGGHDYRAAKARLPIVSANELKARTAAQAVVEKGSAQCCSVSAIARAI